MLSDAEVKTLEGLNISLDLWENTHDHYMAENNQEVFMMRASIPQRLA
jgi:hypothetical protein